MVQRRSIVVAVGAAPSIGMPAHSQAVLQANNWITLFNLRSLQGQAGRSGDIEHADAERSIGIRVLGFCHVLPCPAVRLGRVWCVVLTNQAEGGGCDASALHSYSYPYPAAIPAGNCVSLERLLAYTVYSTLSGNYKLL
jgi:hypothetical protein